MKPNIILNFSEYSNKKRMLTISEGNFSDSPNPVHMERMKNPSTFILKANGIVSMPPSHIDPKERANELLKIKAFIKSSGEKQAKLDASTYDSGMIKKFKQLCEKLGLDFNKKYYKELKKEAKDFILVEKYKWNIPRPSQTARSLRVSFIECSEELASNSPTYPSGHSFYSNIISGVLSKKYPEHKKEFSKLSDLISVSRISAGAHYIPDVKEGKRLANFLIDEGCIDLSES